MRRRQAAPAGAGTLPDRIRRWVPGEWPGETESRQAAAWSAAVNEWMAEHPDHADLIECPPDVAWDPAVDPP